MYSVSPTTSETDGREPEQRRVPESPFSDICEPNHPYRVCKLNALRNRQYACAAAAMRRDVPMLSLGDENAALPPQAVVANGTPRADPDGPRSRVAESVQGNGATCRGCMPRARQEQLSAFLRVETKRRVASAASGDGHLSSER